MSRRQFRAMGARAHQKGIVLIVAIIAIVAMSFAVYAMLRSTTGNLGIAGNIAFKKNATSAADKGVDAGTAWVVANSSVLGTNTGPGYFASWDKNFDPFTYNWSAATAVQVPTDGFGNEIMYVVHRLCLNPGSPSGAAQECVRPSTLNNQGGTGYTRSGGVPTAGAPSDRVTGGALSIMPAAYYRITTRVAGPRNTLSYTQVIIY
jgi:type IV pilus assembly protein PilX